MRNHGKLITFTAQKKGKQQQINNIIKNILSYQTLLNGYLGQKVVTMLVLNSKNKKNVRIIAFESEEQLDNFISGGYSSSGSLKGSYNINQLLNNEKLPEGAQYIDVNSQGEVKTNIKEGLKNSSLFKKLLTTFNGHQKELKQLLKEYQQTEIKTNQLRIKAQILPKLKQKYILESTYNQLFNLLNDEEYKKLLQNLFQQKGKIYTIQKEKNQQQIFNKIDKIVLNKTKQTQNDIIQQQHAHFTASSQGVANEALLQAMFNLGEENVYASSLQNVTNLSGLLEGDISQQINGTLYEIAVKSAGASTLSFPQIIRCANTLANKLAVNQIPYFLIQLKDFLRLGVVSIAGGNIETKIENTKNGISECISS